MRKIWLSYSSHIVRVLFVAAGFIAAILSPYHSWLGPGPHAAEAEWSISWRRNSWRPWRRSSGGMWSMRRQCSGFQESPEYAGVRGERTVLTRVRLPSNLFALHNATLRTSPPGRRRGRGVLQHPALQLPSHGMGPDRHPPQPEARPARRPARHGVDRPLHRLRAAPLASPAGSTSPTCPSASAGQALRHPR